MILQKNNFVTYTLFLAKSKISLREKFPSFLVNKLIVFSLEYTKPVKNSCNDRMLQKKSSPFETTLNKKLSSPFKRILYFFLKTKLKQFLSP